jgi:vacuolar protein sorting-associated protein 13A/C
MPDSMPSLDYRRVWIVSKPGCRPISVWRPQGPPGYASLGDVAMPGCDPPARPVRMYKDVTVWQDAPGEGARLATPLGFHLIYRDSGGQHPLTIWRPVPPKGYQEVGWVAAGMGAGTLLGMAA